MDYLVSTNCLTKQFGQHTAVNNLNIHIRRGEIYGLIGKNGAGKTTFLKMISGLSAPTSGDISIFGYSGKDRKKVLKRIGVLIENPCFYPNMSAADNLKLKCMCSGIYRNGYIENILEIVGLPCVGEKKVENFSLGMKQRLGIAMALIGEPDLLILDEPINGLDPQGIVEVRDILLKLNSERNLTMIISSHILEELSKVVTNYGIINEGNLVKELSRDQLKATCRERLELKLENAQRAIPFLDSLGFKNYKVTDKNTIEIFERLNESERIVRKLSENKIFIKFISLKNKTIEKYFLDIIGGEYHA